MTQLDPRTQRVIRDLAKAQHDLRRQVARLNRGQDAGHITIHNGRSIQLTDENDNVVRRIGADGDKPVEATPPPRPAAPSVVPGQANATVVVAVDGDDEHGETAPDSVVKTRVYATTQPPLEATPGNSRDTITDLHGETTIGLHAGVWHFGVTWVTETGQESELSETVEVEVEAPVDTDDIQAVVDEAKQELEATIDERGNREGTEEPTEPAHDGVVYYQRETEDGAVVAVWQYRDGAWHGLPMTDDVLTSVTTDKLVAGESLIDGVLIKDGAVTLEKITVTEEMVAEFLRVRKIEAGDMDVNNIWADQTWQNAGYFGAETANLQNRTDGRGMEVTAANLDDPEGPRQTLMQVGVFGDNTWVTIDPETGETLSSIDGDGAASFQMIDSETDPTVAGRRLVGGLAQHPASQYSQGILDSIGWGEPAYVSTIPAQGPHAAGEVGLLQANFIAYPGRRYQIVAEAGHFIRNGSTIRANLRYTNNGLDPDIGSPILDHAAIGGTGGWGPLTVRGRISGSTNLESGAPIPVRLLLSINSSADWSFVGGGGYRDLSIQVLDVGPIRPQSGYARNVRSTTGGTTPGVTAYSSAWPASVRANYRNQGAARRTGGTADQYIMQGYDPHNTNFGSQGSLIWFNQATQGEVGATIPAAMAGADLESGSLDVFGDYLPGHLSVRARAYWHEYTTTPNTMTVHESRLIGEFHVPRGGRGSIQLPQACLDAIKNGTFAGIAFYHSDRSLRYALGLSWKYKPNLLLHYTR